MIIWDSIKWETQKVFKYLMNENSFLKRIDRKYYLSHIYTPSCIRETIFSSTSIGVSIVLSYYIRVWKVYQIMLIEQVNELSNMCDKILLNASVILSAVIVGKFNVCMFMKWILLLVRLRHIGLDNFIIQLWKFVKAVSFLYSNSII